MKTIQELEQYLEEKCYNFDSITIGRHYAYGRLYIGQKADPKGRI